MSWNGEDLFRSVLLGSASSGGGSSGGGGGSTVTPSVQPKEVNFYDYDGTLLYAYTVAQAQALTELPAGPEHPGLVFQGWNWSLENVKALTRAMNIGAMYTTDDGTTRLYITLQEGRTSPMLGVGVNGTVTVDWGDGTEPDVLTGTSAGTTKWTPNHAYAAPGDYVIRLTVEGEMAFSGGNSSSNAVRVLQYTTTVTDKSNYVYRDALRKVEIGPNVSFGSNYALSYLTNLKSITIPDGVIKLEQYTFDGCFNLKCIILPKSIESLPQYTFSYLLTLQHVSIPYGIKKLYTGATTQINSLKELHLPDSVRTLGSSAVGLSNSITRFNAPAKLSTIEYAGLSEISSVAILDFTACVAVPTLTSTSSLGGANGIPDDCEVRVPAALYDEWIAATNWTTYADYIKAY